MSTSAPRPTVTRNRPLWVFLILAFGLSWLLAIPLYIGDGIDSPIFLPITLAIMATPSISALLTVFAIERPPRRARRLGLWPLRPVKRLIGYALLGVFGIIAMALIALPIGSLLGVFPADFAQFSAFQETLDATFNKQGIDQPLPTDILVAMQLATLPLAAIVNCIPALGEELGWRGYLFPALLPLGTTRAIVISGVVWGLWHAPVILLGYNYPTAPGWLGLLAMIGTSVILGTLFGWLRLRSHSVWPSTFAHAALNGAGGTFLLFIRSGSTVDTTQATILGWSGWIIPVLFIVIATTIAMTRPRATP